MCGKAGIPYQVFDVDFYNIIFPENPDFCIIKQIKYDTAAVHNAEIIGVFDTAVFAFYPQNRTVSGNLQSQIFVFYSDKLHFYFSIFFAAG